MMNQTIQQMKDWQLHDVIMLAIRNGQKIELNPLADDIYEKIGKYALAAQIIIYE